MENLLPSFDVRGPDDQHFHVELEKDRVTIGRFEVFNDIALEPDPQLLISRKAHCGVERDIEGWWVVDNGSVNSTFLRRGNAVQMVVGRSSLKEGDSILILGKLTETGEPLYWELTFSDPLGTRPAGLVPSAAHLEYDWIQAKLFRVDGASRQEIHNLRPQGHKLVRYMDQRNRARL